MEKHFGFGKSQTNSDCNKNVYDKEVCYPNQKCNKEIKDIDLTLAAMVSKK